MIKRILIILGLWVLVSGFTFDEAGDPYDLSWLPKLDIKVSIDKMIWQKKGEVRTLTIRPEMYGEAIHFQIKGITVKGSDQYQVGWRIDASSYFLKNSPTWAYLSVFIVTNKGVTDPTFLQWDEWDSMAIYQKYGFGSTDYKHLYPRIKYKTAKEIDRELFGGWDYAGVWHPFREESFNQEFVLYNDVVGYKYRIRFTKEQVDKINKMVRDTWLAEEL